MYYMKQNLNIIVAITLLLAATILFVHSSAPGQDAPGKFTIEYQQGRVTAEIENVTLETVLSEVAKQTAIKVNILDKSLAGKEVTLSIQDAEPEQFFKVLLGENYVFSFEQTFAGKRPMLREIWVVSKSLRPSGRTINTKEISYGSGRENIGAIRAGEGANIGPASFTVDLKRNIYVCDTVNKRIQILSPEGKFLSAIQLKGQSPEDIGIDKNGFLYVYDAEGKLYQYDSTGNPVSELSIDETRWESRGPMHIVDNKVYVVGNGSGDVLIARIENGQLAPVSEQELQEPLQDGFLGQSGKRYITSLIDNGNGTAIEVIERDGTKSLRFIPVQEILSIQFLGEDSKGNSYMKTEANTDAGISVQISRFDANGSYLDTVPIPEHRYDFGAVKYVTIGEDGTLYQMMPAKDKLIIRSFLTN